jgi:glycine betaine/proline transport system permease protein
MHYFDLPFAEWVDAFSDWILSILDLTGFTSVVEIGLVTIENFLLWVHPLLIVLILTALAWRIAGKGTAIITLFGFLFIGSVDLWKEMVQTITLVLAATGLSVLIGVPLGIFGARYKGLERVIRPVLDFMQTMPSFVYLIPILLLFGIGRVPGLMATILFCMPPAVRLTILGIRQVPKEIVEAATSFGSTSSQMLFKVQLPMAVPTIMAGINQTIMLAVSMTVIASMIAAPGLGYVVFEAISRVQVGQGFEAGMAIVIVAVILDRISEALGRRNKQLN